MNGPLTMASYPNVHELISTTIFSKQSSNKNPQVTFAQNCFLILIRILHGDLQLCKPMSLCFLEGEENGIGILLGK